VTYLMALDKSRRKKQQQERRERSERRWGVSVPFAEGTYREQVGRNEGGGDGFGGNKKNRGRREGKGQGAVAPLILTQSKREREGPEG
jgi:hypothetical protein